MRASFHAILYKVFSNEEIFNEFINNIIVAAEKYKDIPGFSGRFRHEDLITLLNTLKNLSPKERMKELNKDKVDKFLDYTFRSLLSAHSFKVHNFDEYSDKELLKDNSFGDMNSTMNVISHILLPTQNIISTYTQYENSNIIKNTLNIDSANRKIHYRLDTKTDLSKIYDNEKFKFFAESQGFTTLTSFSTHKDTAVLPYRTGGAHVQLIVRKDSLEQFGIE